MSFLNCDKQGWLGHFISGLREARETGQGWQRNVTKFKQDQLFL